MLDQSKYELEQTVDKLSGKQDSIDDEGNLPLSKNKKLSSKMSPFMHQI